MSQRQRQPAQHRGKARTQDTLPQQRAITEDGEAGGCALVAPALTPNGHADGYDDAASPSRPFTWPRWITTLRSNDRAKAIGFDVLALFIAILDVWLVFPEKAQTYSVVLSTVACAAMLIRRRWPFVAVLVTIPGYLAGWAMLAGTIALGTLAKRRGWVWQTMVGAGLVFLSQYVLWPLEDFFDLSWRAHIRRGIYGVIFAGMPLAIGLLISVRQELSARIAQLAASRSREIRLQEATVRSAERARLAREMHDMVSHQVTLIAMQAGALQVSADDKETRQAAGTIRELSTRTLEELRGLVGVLRSGTVEDGGHPGLEEIGTLMRDLDIKGTVVMEASAEQLPTPVSQAAYRTVQEALTNVRKHAVGAAASVRVVAQQDTLLVEVRNDEPHLRPSGLPSGGHGLLGLRERAGLLGGTFHSGPTSEGGFLVSAAYPIRPAPGSDKPGRG